jgi:hypothetical protein
MGNIEFVNLPKIDSSGGQHPISFGTCEPLVSAFAVEESPTSGIF